jgi:putative nucleotidyltransferase with HDIG domain
MKPTLLPRSSPTSDLAPEPVQDPLPVLKGFASLRRLIGTYPQGHPMVTQKLKELDELVGGHLQRGRPLRIDVVRGDVCLDGVASSTEAQASQQVVHELSALGVDSIHIDPGVEIQELQAVAEFLWQNRDPGPTSVGAQLAGRGVRHISLGKLVPLDTRWRAQQWPDAPTGPLDPSYAESILMAQQTFETTSAGKAIDVATVRDLVELLIRKVARSHAALGQILAVKQYENLTYCHSVNVSVLSLLIGQQIGLDAATLSALVEAALLHDIGKTKIPLEILKKPGALDKRERALMEAHALLGSEILMQTDGLQPLTPIVALEHHRSVKGGGYPDIGNDIPHPMSQIVSVADIYEAVTGARSYQDPKPPDRACLLLARLAGDKLNTGLVKTFVNSITFFPIGSYVRTNRDELGVVVQTNDGEPLHPVVMRLGTDGQPAERIDTAIRGASSAYERHIVETLRAPAGLDLNVLLQDESQAA